MADYRKTNLLRPSQYVRDNPAINRTVDWLIPQIAEKSKVANDLVPESFWQYSLQRYRICSCFKGEASPDALCNACFGTGYLPGYVPLGYRTFNMLDISTPGLILNNVVPDFSSGTHPTPLRLVDTALTGYIETPFLPIEPNLGSFSSIYFSGSNSGVDLFYSLGNKFIPLDESQNPDLKTPAQGSIKFRAYLHRDSLHADCPFLQNVICRVQISEDPLIKMDVPRFVSSLESTDSGLIPLLNTFNAFANFKQKIERDTIFIHQRSKRKFKVLNTNINAPTGKTTSWDLQLRLVQSDESLNRLI